MQRYSQRVFPWPDQSPEIIPDNNGNYVKFADIPPVPEPFPWLDQPDGEGWWFFCHSETGVTIYRTEWLSVNDKRLVCEVFGSDECFFVTDGGGRWQRIPQPTLPMEEGN